MMNRLYIPIFLGLMLLSSACSVADPTKTSQWLMIGEGGGISGAYTNFWLLPNGKIYRREQTDSLYIQMNSMPGRIARQYFKEVRGVFENNGDKPLPDNIYKTIIWQQKGDPKTYMWMYTNEKTEKAEEFYNYLLREMYEHNPTATR